jgi:hypothetical protein
MSKQRTKAAESLCGASKPVETENGSIVVHYCTKPISGHSTISDEHSDGTHVWKFPFSSQPVDYFSIARLLREPQTRVRDWKGDPKRDPALRADVSSFFVPPPRGSSR